MNHLLIIFFLSFLTLPVMLQAQTIPMDKAAAQAELQRRGLNEEEVRAKMKARGIDIDNVKPEQLPQLQPILEEVLKELEQEKAQKASQQVQTAEKQAIQEVGKDLQKGVEATIDQKVKEDASQLSTEVQEKVKDGASVEEAISETLVEETQSSLPSTAIYGHEIFQNQNLTLYRTTKDVKPPESYVMGVGDEIGISIFGMSQADFSFEINEEGFINPAGLQRIYLKGVTFAKAKEIVRSRLSQYYVFNAGQFTMSIKTARTITVNIFGDVNNYGSFVISAVNTGFNALVAAGGPSNIGSVRKIKLVRNGKTKIMDVYQFMNNPTVQYDFFLENNDFIHVPVAERVVSIQGTVKRPFSYELIEGENLIKLIEYAGGLNSDAYTKLIQVRRLANDRQTIIDIDLSDLKNRKGDFTLLPGDQIIVRKMPEIFENFVNIDGAVELPGQYEITNNMRISDLLDKSKLLKEARTDLAFLLRANLDGTTRLEKLNLDSILQFPGSNADFTLQAKDRLLTYTLERFSIKASISVSGAVRNPVKQPFDPRENISVQELLLLAGGLRQDAAEFGYIRRTDPTNPDNREYVRVNLYEALAFPETEINQTLKPGDELMVYTKSRFTDGAELNISGSVREPGKFNFDPDLKISDLVFLAGGLTVDATDFGFITRTDLTNPDLTENIRVNVREAVNNPGSASNIFLLPFDRFSIMSKPAFTDVFPIEVSGAVRSPGAFNYNRNLSLQDLLTQAGGLKMEAAKNKIDIFRVQFNGNEPTQTVVATIEVDENMKPLGKEVVLEPYDVIAVRSVPDFDLQQKVAIDGEVKYPGVYALTTKNERLYDVLTRSGGLSVEAFPEGATLYRNEENIGFVITRLDKVMKRKKSRFNYVLKPGDIISIPKSKDLVSIKVAATLAGYLYSDKLLTPGKINVAYHKGKRAKWYVKKYANGINREQRAKIKLITVEHPNGELRRTANFLFFKASPKVRKGSIISVGVKPVKPAKPEKEDKERSKPIDWNLIITNGLALTASAFTIIVLAKQL